MIFRVSNDEHKKAMHTLNINIYIERDKMSNIYAYNTLIILEGEYYIQYMVYMYNETKKYSSLCLIRANELQSCQAILAL